MSKFKVGDKVRCSKVSGYSFTPCVAEIHKARENFSEIIVSGQSWIFRNEWLELIRGDRPEKTKFVYGCSQLPDFTQCMPGTTIDFDVNIDSRRWYGKSMTEKANEYKEDIMNYLENNIPNKNKIMNNIVTFAKDLLLSADEKLLRKMGLKDECGEYTCEAEDLVRHKLIKDNEPYLLEIAKAKELEDSKK